MLSERDLPLEAWTRDRLAEMRRVAATEAQLASLRSSSTSSWTRRVARQLGGTMVALGRWIESHSGVPAQAER